MSARIASPMDKALAVSHGGIIELPAIFVMERLKIPIKGDVFAYADACA